MRKRFFPLVLAFAVVALCASWVAQERGRGPIAVMGIVREVAPVEARLESATSTTIQGFVFTSGAINGNRIIAARSAPGKVNAAVVATLLIDHFSPSAVVFTGTAGAIDAELDPGDVVIATAVGYHDFGSVTADGFVRSPTRSVSGSRDPAFFPADSALLAAARRAASILKPSQGRIREGLVVTGDAFIANPSRRVDLRRELNASAVEMEGAAVAQVCAHLGVPFIVIRSITDHADGNASGSYQRFVEVASKNAADLTVATIQQMIK